MKLIYWSNKMNYHSEKLYECEALTLAEADKSFQTFSGFDPAKTNWVSVQLVHED